MLIETSVFAAGGPFSAEEFVCGPSYGFQQHCRVILIFFFYGQANLLTWVTGRNMLPGGGSTDVFKGLRVE